MKPLHLKEHIFNLDAIVMIEPYDDGGLVHCTDNHAYRISEAEYQELREWSERTQGFNPGRTSSELLRKD